MTKIELIGGPLDGAKPYFFGQPAPIGQRVMIVSAEPDVENDCNPLGTKHMYVEDKGLTADGLARFSYASSWKGTPSKTPLP